MDEKQIEKQTRQLIHVKKLMAAQQEKRAARQEQLMGENNEILSWGFQETLGALEEQTDLLRTLNDAMYDVKSEIRDLRNDIYASTKDRELLEAQSKLERADVLLGSDLPGDALLLIRQALSLIHI